jgi:hypothetical protein
MNTNALLVSFPAHNVKLHEAYLKGTSSLRSATDTVKPYHGQMIQIWDEKAMKEIRQEVKVTLDCELRAAARLEKGADTSSPDTVPKPCSHTAMIWELVIWR